MNIGFAMCGSFCTYAAVFPIMEQLAQKHMVIPIFSNTSYTVNSRFGTAEEHIARAESICDRAVLHTIEAVEPIGPKKLLDVLLVAPCTGNTIAKLAHSIADTPVTMAVKSHLRNAKPVVIAISTNDALGGAAENTFAVLPAVGNALETDVSLGVAVVKLCDGELAVGVLAAIHAAAGQKAGQLGDGDAIQLLLENMVNALLKVGDLGLQALEQTLGDLPEVDAGFAGGIQEGNIRVGEKLLGEHIQHLVDDVRRGKDLVIGQIRKTGQNVRIIDCSKKTVIHFQTTSCRG